MNIAQPAQVARSSIGGAIVLSPASVPGAGSSGRRSGAALCRDRREGARNPFWYREGQVSDTIDGRFDMIAAIIALVLLRLEAAGRSLACRAVLLTETFIDDMDASLRQLGIGDHVVGKHVGRMTSALGGRLAAFRTARESGSLARPRPGATSSTRRRRPRPRSCLGRGGARWFRLGVSTPPSAEGADRGEPVMTTPEFSRPGAGSTRSATVRAGSSVEAEEVERINLARRFGLVAIDGLAAELALTRKGRGRQPWTGSCPRRSSQSCVATGEPIDAGIEVPVNLVFRPASRGGRARRTRSSSAPNELDVIFHDGFVDRRRRGGRGDPPPQPRSLSARSRRRRGAEAGGRAARGGSPPARRARRPWGPAEEVKPSPGEPGAQVIRSRRISARPRPAPG
jgi:hypothetical protein